MPPSAPPQTDPVAPSLHPRAPLVRWAAAFAGFYRPDVEEVRRLDALSRFLFAARSVILVISAQAAIIAGLLAALAGRFALAPFLLVLAGFVVAHMVSNLSNDWFDYARGHDTPDSPRLRYTVHPVASGVLTSRQLALGIAILAAIGFAIFAVFVAARGMPAVWFMAAGVALLVLYDAVPVPLKAIGLGEIAAFVVWGPLMVTGGYAMIAGTLAITPLIASIPYGLGVMSILLGKHVDQRVFDAHRGTRTLPVVVGERAACNLTIASIVLMYAITLGAVVVGALPATLAIVAIALPRAGAAVHRLRAPRPAQAPAGYVGWPLWHHRACLEHNRLFGWLYIAGFAAAVVVGW